MRQIIYSRRWPIELPKPPPSLDDYTILHHTLVNRYVSRKGGGQGGVGGLCISVHGHHVGGELASGGRSRSNGKQSAGAVNNHWDGGLEGSELAGLAPLSGFK